jgi:hypothetical protein
MCYLLLSSKELMIVSYFFVWNWYFLLELKDNPLAKHDGSVRKSELYLTGTMELLGLKYSPEE